MDAQEQLAYCEWRQMVKDAYSHAGRKYAASIDNSWLEQFAFFKADMGLPQLGQKLCRHDSSKPFNKANCSWQS